jgi:hypothetical protein
MCTINWKEGGVEGERFCEGKVVGRRGGTTPRLRPLQERARSCFVAPAVGSDVPRAGLEYACSVL